MVKASAYNAGDPGLIPGLGRSSGEGNGNPLQYPCLYPWTGEPGRLQSMGSQSQTRLSDFTSLNHLGASQVMLVVKNPPANSGDVKHGLDPWIGKIPWRREWVLTPVFLLGESHGQRSLVSYSP